MRELRRERRRFPRRSGLASPPCALLLGRGARSWAAWEASALAARLPTHAMAIAAAETQRSPCLRASPGGPCSVRRSPPPLCCRTPFAENAPLARNPQLDGGIPIQMGISHLSGGVPCHQGDPPFPFWMVPFVYMKYSRRRMGIPV